MFTELRTSGPLHVDEYDEIVRCNPRRLGSAPGLKLQEIDAAGELEILCQMLQEKTEQLLSALAPFRSNTDRAQKDTYDRVANHLDRKYKHPLLALYYDAVGDAGVEIPDNTLSLAVNEGDLARFRQASFAIEYDDQQNPFALEYTLFREGLWPKGFRIVEGEERYIVDVPVVLRSSIGNGLIMMGCWSQGEIGINYIHSLMDDCQYNMQVTKSFEDSVARQVGPKPHALFTHTPPVLSPGE